MRMLVNGMVRLNMQEAMFLYRKMFPHDVSTFTSKERRSIADHIERYINLSDTTQFEAYHYTAGDSMAEALKRLERGFKKLESGGWDLRAAKGPMLPTGESEGHFIYVSALRAHRIRKGWTIKMLAERVGMSGSAMSSIELGKASLTHEVARECARVLGVKMADLSGFVKIHLSADVERNTPNGR